jgi:DNA-binding transcriptional regulator GbsR (MarR family)
MQYENPLDMFIEGWGRMGAHWGVGKVMAEIQALLYLSAEPLSLEDMSEKLKTSRSNISLNVRALQDLGVVHKVIRPGDRKDYYEADEDLGRVARRLAAKKKKRELDPALRIVNDVIVAASSHAAARDRHGSVPETKKLHDLKELLAGIAGVFDTFIGETSNELRDEQTIKT